VTLAVHVSATVFDILTLNFHTPSLFEVPWLRNAIRYRRNLYTAEKCI